MTANQKIRLFQEAIDALPAHPSDDTRDQRWFRSWVIELREEARLEVEQVQEVLHRCFLNAVV